MKRILIGLSVFLALCAGGSLAHAAISAGEIEDNREASFLPPPVALNKEEGTAGAAATQAASAPTELPKAESPKTEPPADLKNLTQGGKPELQTPPTLAAPPAIKADSASVEAPKVEALKGEIPPAAAAPVPNPGPIVTTIPQTAPAAPETLQPVEPAKPVASKPLADVDPESVGLLSQPNDGGLGAALWGETPLALVTRLLPAVGLPTASPTLNDLAKRLLLTAAALPTEAKTTKEGEKKPHTLLSIRVERLMALGAVSEAWKLASMADPKLIDSITMRLLVEAALLGPEGKEACEKVPSYISQKDKDDVGEEWQKVLILCKLREGDQSAVQLGLDLLREQQAKDDLFLTLVTRNVLAGGKVLPRQLTPLRPINLAVLRRIDAPLPPELYARPDAVLIPELLQTKGTQEDKYRLALAERAAASGIISAKQLGEAYSSLNLNAQEASATAALADSVESPRVRVALYQEAAREQDPQKRIIAVQRLLAQSTPRDLVGSLGVLAADLIKDVPPSSDYNLFSASAAQVMALAGKAEKAMSWLKIAQASRDRIPDVSKQYVQNWPFYALSGLVADGEYAKELRSWLDFALGDEGEATAREKREKAGRVLLVMSAAGFAVPDEAWLRVIEAMPATKQLAASPLLVERLKIAGQAKRKGETILLSLLVCNEGASEIPVSAAADTIKALRQIGLVAESQAFARETVAGLMMP